MSVGVQVAKIEFFQSTSDHSLLFQRDEQRAPGEPAAEMLFDPAPSGGGATPRQPRRQGALALRCRCAAHDRVSMACQGCKCMNGASDGPLCAGE